jgi:hypothetical protein
MNQLFTPLSDFRGIHKGKVAFVIAPGRTLKEFDYSNLNHKKSISICVNKAFHSYPNCTYLFFSDIAMFKLFPETIKQADETPVEMIFATYPESHWLKSQQFLDFRSSLKHLSVVKRSGTRSVDFKTPSDVLIRGADVSQPAAHLAQILGCSSIVLVGVDLCWPVDDFRYVDAVPLDSEFRSTEARTSKFFDREYLEKLANPMGPPYRTLVDQVENHSDLSCKISYFCWAEIAERVGEIPIYVFSRKSLLSDFFPVWPGW